MKNPESPIVIAGSGIAGIAAAIAVAEQHREVLLVERSATLGGIAINANPGTLCGVYYRSVSGVARIAGNKFCQSLIKELLAFSGWSPINYHKGLFVIPYEWAVLQAFFEQKLSEHNILLWTNAEINGVEIIDKRIARLNVLKDGTPQTIETESVVDCTGNGIISRLAHLEMITAPVYQAASQIFRLENVMSDNEFSLNMALKKAMTQFVVANNWPDGFKTLSAIPGSLRNKGVDLKLTLPDEITDDAGLNRVLEGKAKAYVNKIFQQLKGSLASFKEAELGTVYPGLGIRIQQRSKGKYILTETDVLACKRDQSGIAIGTWPIEEWGSDGRVKMQYPENDEGYLIPADCLISHELSNLFFAGRNISATDKAVASARVMGTCLQTGYAAGKMATCGGEIERKKMIAKLNDELHTTNG